MAKYYGRRRVVIIRELDMVLNKNRFKLIENENIKKLDLLYYTNQKINVFLGNQNYQSIGYKEINDLAYKLREVLIKKNINIYNSYLIYCIEYKDIKEEDLILLERSSKYLRKYIVRDNKDIERIFFLNNNLEYKNIKYNPFPDINQDIQELVEKMKDDETLAPLNSKQVDEIVENILRNIGDRHED